MMGIVRSQAFATSTVVLGIFALLALREAVLAGDNNQAQNAERARSILAEGFASSDPNIRTQSIVAASMINRREPLLARLEPCAQDKDVQVRIAAVDALADLKLPGSVPTLEKVLKSDQVPEVAFAAAKALYRLNDPEGKTAMMDVYDGRVNPNSNFLKKQSRSFFRNFYSVKSATMFLAAQSVGFVPVPGAGQGFAAMTDLLSDPDLSARASVVLLLGKQATPEALALLKRALDDEDWSVRASAAQTIAQTDRSELRESLVPLFDDKKEKVRFRAAGAYLHVYMQKRS